MLVVLWHCCHRLSMLKNDAKNDDCDGCAHDHDHDCNCGCVDCCGCNYDENR